MMSGAVGAGQHGLPSGLAVGLQFAAGWAARRAMHAHHSWRAPRCGPVQSRRQQAAVLPLLPLPTWQHQAEHRLAQPVGVFPRSVLEGAGDDDVEARGPAPRLGQAVQLLADAAAVAVGSGQGGDGGASQRGA
jgi:hypothetical protein